MSYRTLLLCLADDAGTHQHLDLAIALARHHACHLIGLSIRPPSSALADEVGQIDAAPLDLDIERVELRARDREKAFVQRCDAEGLASFECVIDRAETGRAMIRWSHTSDLVLIGQPDPSHARYLVRRSILNDVLIRSSAPVMVFPRSGTFRPIGERIVVAWDDSRAAARAAALALPQLVSAKEVLVIKFERSASETGPIPQESIVPVTQWLARHGVRIRGLVSSSAEEPGAAILSAVAAYNADLLVMGAWGQSRLVEELMGGATRTALERMMVPVQTSH